MGWFEGLLGGFVERKGQVEAENVRQAELSRDREGRVLQALLSSPDPEVQSLAVAGLLSSAGAPKRKGGLRGWIGEMEANPYLDRIRSLAETPTLGVEEVPGTPTLPSRSMTGYIATPPSPTGALAQAPTSPTEAGAPSLTALSPDVRVDETVTAEVDRSPASAVNFTEHPSRPTTERRPVLKKRQLFLTPEEAMLRNKRAAAQGDVEGEVAGLVASGYSEEEARALVAKKYERRYGTGSAAYQSIPGEMPDGSPAFGVFDRTQGKYIDPDTQLPLEGFRPRTTTGSTSLGADREAISRAKYGKPYAQLTQVEQQDVLAEEISRAGTKAGAVTTGRGEASANVPLSTQQRFQATENLTKQWTTERAAGRLMEQQFTLMQTGLSRYDADPIGASQAVLVTFQKILDPTSVVRESEYARTPQGLAILDRLQGLYDRYKAGGAGVPQEVLAEMVETARQFLENTKGASNGVRDRIYKTAVDYEIDPGNVLGPDMPTTAPVRTPGAAPAGRIGAPPPGAAAAPAQAAPGAEWQMINGVLHYQGKPY